MTYDDLITNWQPHAADPTADTALWDAMADGFSHFDIPTVENNTFMHFLSEKELLETSRNALDIGCGGGKYALALADYCPDGVIGTDLSPKMIAAARENAVRFSKENLVFRTENWHTLDLQRAGMEGAFDLVYAHNTPAIQCLSDFEKLIAASRKHCVVSLPVRRQDKIQDALYAQFFPDIDQQHRDRNLLYMFEALWYKGYEPHIAYDHQHWHSRRSLEKTETIMLNRIRSRQSLSPKLEQAIHHWLEDRAVDGMIEEETQTTIAMLYWQV